MMASSDLQPRTMKVLSASRRFVFAWDGANVIEARASTKAIEVVAGDVVLVSNDGKSYVVDSIEPRKNVLSRFVAGAEKFMVANLDLVVIITAVGDVFNPVSIDRILAIARQQEIPRTLILNKIDLGGSELLAGLMDWYEAQGIDVLRISAKHQQGIDQVRSDIFRPGVLSVAFTGVSGVGKSTLLNALVPEAGIKTGIVSVRTGQGKQTTTQVTGYLMKKDAQAAPVLVYDLPGVQKFGVGHLSKEAVIGEFAEFGACRCAYSDCSHINEEECGVKDAVDSGSIPLTRYNSYVGMIQEVEEEAARY